MTIDLILDVVNAALMNTLYLSAPILGISIVVGLGVSILQTTTSIQEQTLTFVPKIIAIILMSVAFGGWIANRLVEFTINLWMSVPQLLN